MRARLSTPTVHRVISSPLGALLDKPAFERIKLARLPLGLSLLRLGAAASAMASADVDELLRVTGVRAAIPHEIRRRLEKGLARFTRHRRAKEEASRRWENAFWGDGFGPIGDEDLVRIEIERRKLSNQCVMPSATLGFFATTGFVPPIAYQVPSPGDFTVKWTSALVRPELLFVAPKEMPKIERSQRMRGPAGLESFLRFQSPSALGDRVYAKVFEPVEDPRATFIYVGGLFAPCDSVTYWPEEEYMGRSLAARGHRVVLVEPPFHGRRAPLGKASGEACLATAPEGFFQLAAAGAQEVAVLVAWARALGSRVVGVGGTSTGALVAQELAGRALSFPRGMRPDIVLCAGAGLHLDEVLLKSPLAQKLGLPKAILDAGWTAEALACLRDLLDPPSEPGIAPDRIFALLGAEDPLLPFGRGRELLRQWRVPEENVTLVRGGELGMLLHLVRHSDVQLKIARALYRAARAA